VTTLIVRAVGRPAPQGSHELGANGYVMHSSNYLAAWRRQVQIAALESVQAAGYLPGQLPVFGPGVPVYVHELTLIVWDDQCRATGTDEPTGRPDVDKLLRATIDGLGDAKLFADDAQITKMYELSKVRPWADELPGAIIVISDRPLPVVIRQGESMTSTEYRISLERVTRDADGDRVYETTFELFGTAAQVGSVGLGAVGALLGAGQVTVVDSSAAREQQAELGGEQQAPADGEPKRGRGRPRKSTAPAAPAAEPVAAGPVSESAPVAEPPAVPVAQAPAEPVAPAGRVNPFA
jgi:hypothetical protein